MAVPGRGGRSLRAGNVEIMFFGKGAFDRSRTTDVKTPTGSMRVSDPETTAWDLVRYSALAGGLGNVATVLSELTERIDRRRLVQTARRHGDQLVVRRLGYLLAQLHRKDLARSIGPLVGAGPARRLDPAEPATRSREDRRWRLIINATVEPEA